MNVCERSHHGRSHSNSCRQSLYKTCICLLMNRLPRDGISAPLTTGDETAKWEDCLGNIWKKEVLADELSHVGSFHPRQGQAGRSRWSLSSAYSWP